MKKAYIFILCLLIFFTLAACRSKDNGNNESTETTTRNETTQETSKTDETTTTEPAYIPDEFVPITLEKLANDPISEVPDADFDVLTGNGMVDIIGEGNKIYLRYNSSYYMVWDIGAPVSESTNIYFLNINNDGTDEIFINDLGNERTRILAYDPSADVFKEVLDADTVEVSYFSDSPGFWIYSADRKQFPYTLYLYYYENGKFLIQNVSLATRNEYSVISEGRYIFAGTEGNISLYMQTGTELNKIDASLYIISRSVFPDSDTRTLTIDDLKKVTGYELSYAVSEIYSRHGYVFEDENMRQYFEEKPWYIADETFELSMLGDVEKANVDLISSYISLLSSNLKIYDDMQADTDINGDGKTDDITLEIDGDNYSIKINDKTIEGSGEALINKLYVLDIDKTDQYMEVAVSEAGPSDDYATYIYYYNGSEIIYMGAVQGSGDGLSLDGSGELYTYKRGSILQTWFYAYGFRLGSERLLTGIDQDEYHMNTFVMLQKDLDVYDSKTDKILKFVIKAGEPALIVSTDDSSYCRIRNGGGDEGFFLVKNFDDINSTGISSGEYFHGLVFAD